MYYEETENSIIKYEVQVDKERLEKVRKIIIFQCSKRFYKEGHWLPNVAVYPLYHDEHFINIRTTVAGVQEYFDGPNEDMYDVEYIELEFPEIIQYIDQVLNGNYSNLSKLLENPLEESKLEEPEQINQLYQDASSLIAKARIHTVEHIDELICGLQGIKSKIEKLQNIVQANENRHSVAMYHLDIIGCIQLIKIEEMDKDIYQKVMQFCR